MVGKVLSTSLAIFLHYYIMINNIFFICHMGGFIHDFIHDIMLKFMYTFGLYCNVIESGVLDVFVVVGNDGDWLSQN